VRINEFPAQSRAPLIFAELIFVSLTDDGAATVMVIDKGKAFARINTLSGALVDCAEIPKPEFRSHSLKPADAGDSVCSFNDTIKIILLSFVSHSYNTAITRRLVTAIFFLTLSLHRCV